MKYLVLFSLAACITSISMAQGKSIRVKAGDDLAQAYSPNGFYRFPQFFKALVYSRNGGRSSGPLFNYNLLSGNMQFINAAGDTLDMGNPENFDSLVFDKSVFVYKDGFMEMVASNDSLRLLKKLVLRAQTENIGAYGLPNSTASITNMKNFTTGSSVYNLVINQDVVLDENVTWFFSSGGNTVKANKSNLLKILPVDKAARAEAYLRQNKTNFEKETDLRKLMAAIAG
jgi:hypothetical protein